MRRVGSAAPGTLETRREPTHAMGEKYTSNPTPESSFPVYLLTLVYSWLTLATRTKLPVNRASLLTPGTAFCVEMFATVSWFDTVRNAIYCCTLALVRSFMLAGRWWCIHILTRLLTIHQSIRTRRLGVAKSVFIRVYTVVGPSVPKALATCY